LLFRDKKLFENVVGDLAEIFGILRKKDIKIKSRYKKVSILVFLLTNVQLINDFVFEYLSVKKI